jgi:hypothetical protein
VACVHYDNKKLLENVITLQPDSYAVLSQEQQRHEEQLRQLMQSVDKSTKIHQTE